MLALALRDSYSRVCLTGHHLSSRCRAKGWAGVRKVLLEASEKRLSFKIHHTSLACSFLFHTLKRSAREMNLVNL